MTAAAIQILLALASTQSQRAVLRVAVLNTAVSFLLLAGVILKPESGSLGFHRLMTGSERRSTVQYDGRRNHAELRMSQSFAGYEAGRAPSFAVLTASTKGRGFSFR